MQVRYTSIVNVNSQATFYITPFLHCLKHFALCFQGLETYFWQAPEDYIGNKLVSYGQKIRIKTSWHIGRGDTAGISTKGPDIIIEVNEMNLKTICVLPF